MNHSCSHLIKLLNLIIKPIVYDEKFSDERWKALDTYVAESSRWSVAYVCIKPIVIIPIIIFCIFGALPLRPIEEGFWSNYSLLSISFISSCLAGAMLTLSFQYLFPQRKIPWNDFLSIVITEGIGFTMAYSYLDTYVCFPFPFVTIFSTICSSIPVGTAFYFILAKPLRELPNFWSMLFHFGALSSLIFSMFVVYPYITYLFRQSQNRTGHQLLVIVLFVATRRTFKKLLIIICQGVHRPAPFLSVAYVNAFHAIYLSIVLQQGIDVISLLVVMIFDIGGNIFALREMYKIQQKYELEISQSITPVGSTTKNEHKNKMRQHLLIRAENWVLVEYVECIIPVTFSLLLCGFYFLESTNTEYYKIYKGLDWSKFRIMQRDLLIYAFLECTILFLFVRSLVKLLKVPLWHLLGYILHTDFWPFMLLMTSWYGFSLSASLDHAGNNWSFYFQCRPPP